MNLNDLKSPFPAEDIEWRIQSSGVKNGKPWGICLPYVTARAIEDRLDEVCGPENWRNTYKAGPEGGVLCGISIKTDSGWVTKWNGAENTNIEKIKGGLSAAMKRAGSTWGIGRYLYNLSADFANFTADGIYKAKIDNSYHKWNPPALPAWALPGGSGKPEAIGAAPAPLEQIEQSDESESKSSRKLTYEESANLCLDLKDRMNSIKNVFELKAWWKKHNPEIISLHQSHRDEVTEKKDGMKADFENAEE